MQLGCFDMGLPRVGTQLEGLFHRSLEVKLPTIWTHEKQRWEEAKKKVRRESQRREREKEDQRKENHRKMNGTVYR